MSRARILVLGAGGLLGGALLRRGLDGLDRSACDVTDPRAREAALARHRPDAVIFCAARSDVDACEHDAESWRINAEAPGRWARRVPLWFVSTNYVFSGPGPHAPMDPRRPLQAYGRQKLAAEEAVLAAGGHVVRTGWLFGPCGRNLLSSLPLRLARGPVSLFDDRPIQPTSSEDLAALLASLPEARVLHAVGREETTFLRFGRALARLLGFEARVVAHPGPAFEARAPRPLDARLRPASLPGWSEGLEVLAALSRG